MSKRINLLREERWQLFLTNTAQAMLTDHQDITYDQIVLMAGSLHDTDVSEPPLVGNQWIAEQQAMLDWYIAILEQD